MTQKPKLRVEVGAVSCSRCACVAHKGHAREKRGAWASATCKALGCVYPGGQTAPMLILSGDVQQIKFNTIYYRIKSMKFRYT
jgi:hypothetical protein